MGAVFHHTYAMPMCQRHHIVDRTGLPEQMGRHNGTCAWCNLWCDVFRSSIEGLSIDRAKNGSVPELLRDQREDGERQRRKNNFGAFFQGE